MWAVARVFGYVGTDEDLLFFLKYTFNKVYSNESLIRGATHPDFVAIPARLHEVESNEAHVGPGLRGAGGARLTGGAHNTTRYDAKKKSLPSAASKAADGRPLKLVPFSLLHTGRGSQADLRLFVRQQALTDASGVPLTAQRNKDIYGKIRESLVARGDTLPPLDAWRVPPPDVVSEVAHHNSRLAVAIEREARVILEPSVGDWPSHPDKLFRQGNSLLTAAAVVRGHTQKLFTGEQAQQEKFVGPSSRNIINRELALMHAELSQQAPNPKPYSPNPKP
mmetsp:Transcript_35405/g.83830  ORF Transcript_35405/g.83830 Transcript_35405/m.83830 type:complete len:279 (+) Transcript_35405:426-1262(+)